MYEGSVPVVEPNLTSVAVARAKTHRILAWLANRGIVTLKKYGNTNEVLLSD